MVTPVYHTSKPTPGTMKEEHLVESLGDGTDSSGGGYQVIWHQFKENTTAHGIPHITNASGKLKKSFWIFITMGTLVLLLATLYLSFTKYFSHPVEVRLQITTSLKLNFPAITVCNMNPIKSSLLSNLPTSAQSIVSGKRRRKRDVTVLEDLTQQSLYDQQKKKRNRQRRSSSVFNTTSCSIPIFNDSAGSWCYEFYDTNTYTLSDAAIKCPQTGAGTTLVVLDTPDKIDHMKTYYGNVSSYWLNADEEGSSWNRQWTWGDGSGRVANGNWNAIRQSIFSWTWSEGKPATSGPCLYVDGHDSHKFVPASCTESHRLMCQTHYGTQSNTTSGATTEPAGVLFSDTHTAEEMPLTAEYVQAELLTELLADIPVAFKSALGFQQHELLIDCQYNGRLCVQSDISTYFNPILGNCYTYNHRNEKTTFKTGRRYGLSLVLNVAQDEYVKTAGDVAGIRLVPHHPDTMPFPEDEGLLLQPGLLTSIGLRQTNIMRQGGIYSDCIDSSFNDYSKDLFMETFNKSYGQASCSKTCYQERLTATCGCADPSYPMSGIALGGRAYHACSTANTTQVDCRQTVTDLFNTNSLECVCPTPCSQVWLTSQVSSGQWPNDVQKNTTLESLRGRIPGILDVPDDPDKYKRNLAKVEVYFEELNWEEISEKPAYTETQLISDIGGLLGLFIGFSVMTIFEFIQLLVEVIVLLISSCCFTIQTPYPKVTKVAPKKPLVGITPQVDGTNKMQTNDVTKGGFIVCNPTTKADLVLI